LFELCSQKYLRRLQFASLLGRHEYDQWPRSHGRYSKRRIRRRAWRCNLRRALSGRFFNAGDEGKKFAAIDIETGMYEIAPRRTRSRQPAARPATPDPQIWMVRVGPRALCIASVTEFGPINAHDQRLVVIADEGRIRLQALGAAWARASN